MIKITETDDLLPEILKESKLSNLITKEKYHVYGLRRENHPVVSIDYDEYYIDDEFRARLKGLCEFFKLNNIDIEKYDSSGDRGIQIGLRIDLRKTLNIDNKPLLAAAVLSTIVYCLEGRIDIDEMKKYKLSSIPRFNRQNVDA